MASLEMVLTAAGALIEEYSVCVCVCWRGMPEDTRPPFFNFCNPDCQMCLMRVINLIGWITVPFFNATFCHVLDFSFQSDIRSIYLSFCLFVCAYTTYTVCFTKSNYIYWLYRGFLGAPGHGSKRHVHSVIDYVKSLKVEHVKGWMDMKLSSA